MELYKLACNHKIFTSFLNGIGDLEKYNALLSFFYNLNTIFII